MKKQASFTVDQYGFIDRYNLGKLGEKFLYSDNSVGITTIYNSDGSNYLVYDKSFHKNTKCTVDGRGDLITTSLKNNGNFDISYYCSDGSIGFSDENGNSFFNSNEPIKDYEYYKNGIFTSTGGFFSKPDSIKTVKYYENNNGVLTFKKTFTDTRTMWFSYSPVTQFNEKFITQTTKDKKVNVYDTKLNLLFSTPVQFPSELYIVGAQNVSQKLFNTDDKYEFSLFYFDKDFNVKALIYDEAGKVLASFSDFSNMNSSGTRMIVTEPNNVSRLLELPGFKEIAKITSSSDYFEINEKSQNVNIIRKNTTDSTISILDEKLVLAKKFKYSNNISGYTLTSAGDVFEQPDGKYGIISTYNSIQDPTKKRYRLTFADGKTQDLNGYGNYSFRNYPSELAPKFYFNSVDAVAKTNKIDVYAFTPGVGVNESFEPLLGVEAFPNPFENELNVKLPNNATGTTNITVSNQLGQILLKKQSTDNVINIKEVANVQQGIYFITVENNGKKAIQKVVKY